MIIILIKTIFISIPIIPILIIAFNNITPHMIFLTIKQAWDYSMYVKCSNFKQNTQIHLISNLLN